jgi:hypothetical protein
MSMTENERPPTIYKIDIAITINVIQVGALSPLDDERIPAYGAEGPYGGIDSTREQICCDAKIGT